MMVTKLEYREILHIMTNKLCFQESAREIFKFIYQKTRIVYAQISFVNSNGNKYKKTNNEQSCTA